ncbi:MAG: hypothetical protein QM638_02860 [Nocardioides sp.]|uniref:hypothetical protein n=1 Tax=Nocardioides sp. TaxID=35761 RepID=UPI0039E38DA7
MTDYVDFALTQAGFAATASELEQFTVDYLLSRRTMTQLSQGTFADRRLDPYLEDSVETVTPS